MTFVMDGRGPRVLVVADGFYEWAKDPATGAKTPVRIKLRSDEPLRWPPTLFSLPELDRIAF